MIVGRCCRRVVQRGAQARAGTLRTSRRVRQGSSGRAREVWPVAAVLSQCCLCSNRSLDWRAVLGAARAVVLVHSSVRWLLIWAARDPRATILTRWSRQVAIHRAQVRGSRWIEQPPDAQETLHVPRCGMRGCSGVGLAVPGRQLTLGSSALLA